MKKLTTKHYLIGGGIIALIYILYRKQKSKNGSNIIKEAMSDSKKENDKDYSKPPKVEVPIKNGVGKGVLRDVSIFDSREEGNRFDVLEGNRFDVLSDDSRRFNDSRRGNDFMLR